MTRLAEALLLLCIVAAPWPYGSSPDVALYALAAVLLLAAGLWTLGRAQEKRGLPFLLPYALALPLLALVQLALGRSAAPVWTAEAFLLLAAMLLVVCFWSERGLPLSHFRHSVCVEKLAGSGSRRALCRSTR